MATACCRAAEQASHPTLSMSAQVNLPSPRHRSAFLQELQAAMQALAEKYGVAHAGPGSEAYKLLLACYPAEV